MCSWRGGVAWRARSALWWVQCREEGCGLLTPSLPGAECGFLLNMAFLIPS